MWIARCIVDIRFQNKFIYDDITFKVENLDLYNAKLVLDKYILEQQVYNDLYEL